MDRFKWAELSLLYLFDPDREDTADDIRDHWEAIKDQPNQGILDNLINIYDQIYRRALPTNPSSAREMNNKAEAFLTWVFCAQQSLQVEELSSILSREPRKNHPHGRNEDSILKPCRSLVFKSESGTVQISHSSVRDYLALRFSDRLEQYRSASDILKTDSLNDPKRILEDAHDVALLRCNLQVAKACISVLLDTNQTTLTKAPPMVRYAAKNWLGHTTRTMDDEKVIPADLDTLVMQFFSNENRQAFENWLSVGKPDELRSHNSAKVLDDKGPKGSERRA